MRLANNNAAKLNPRRSTERSPVPTRSFQVNDSVAGLWQITGSQVAQGYSVSKGSTRSLASLTAAYKDSPRAKAAKK